MLYRIERSSCRAAATSRRASSLSVSHDCGREPSNKVLALHLDIEIASFFFIVPLASLATAIPLGSPGGLGQLEAAYVALFRCFGFSEKEGILLALIQANVVNGQEAGELQHAAGGPEGVWCRFRGPGSGVRSPCRPRRWPMRMPRPLLLGWPQVLRSRCKYA